ncbi:hypothetical protein A3A05_01685 [Candidatus Nomurabacteria bacterium RIFCSPLOWO2_01_FULL_41_12]|uniref:Uncharacterized protein n=1 Tax=Candidatus Nomurabacteria bacterium RIFCSPLOWO2_01_FULL_41_12 TaxID=1801774 RepID=A0A1F6WUR5_9BACT|nr:MAG: hypothetical protein A2732_00955 [Candidatus Nomurabacteria bacterium RIFCSPHIGHO2_01_FULL_40_10]OGI85616.1 MAG: hypothetical protein A3A05_01685 [Candidatus Nomurabacteria bacterium RIFCSPLOWO2_01_FULL_41_12]
MIKINKTKHGYAILELLFYIVFFSILSLVVINAMITMARIFRETTVYAELVQSGVIMERIGREIRTSYDISSISSSDLALNTTDSIGANKTIRFLLSGTDLQFFENAVLTGNLNTPNIVVTGLTFSQITTVQGKTVKVVLSLRSSNDKLNRVQDFYDTIVLRGGY